MERVLLVRENTFFRGYPVVLYLSLSQSIPKFESAHAEVWVSSYPSHCMIDSYLISTLPVYSKHLTRAREQMSIVTYDKVVKSSEN